MRQRKESCCEKAQTFLVSAFISIKRFFDQSRDRVDEWKKRLNELTKVQCWNRLLSFAKSSLNKLRLVRWSQNCWQIGAIKEETCGRQNNRLAIGLEIDKTR